ncbi:hypothetical protein ACFWPH_33320 [Nocardia sp. NPDC058499]|uniref:hypothetical protein n=1 Tax=Nocardia sp. NPDC058499 TaxID=3346530 RepID=UPI0036566EEE
MTDREADHWTFLDEVSVSPSMVSSVDSVVILTEAEGPFSSLHGGWICDVDRARAASVALTQRERLRVRPTASNHQFRFAAPRRSRRAAADSPDVQGVRLPRPGEPHSGSIEIRVFWAGMQLITDARDRLDSQQVSTIERTFRSTCGACFYARSMGVEDPLIGESLADVAELAELLVRARDSRDTTMISVGGERDDVPARAVGFLASGLPSAVTIEMREQ